MSRAFCCLTTLATVVLAAAALAAATPASAAAPTDWPQWRGPTRDGHLPAASAPWPASLGEDALQLRWRVELGPSYSGPIVVGSRVFVTETVDEKTEVVRALDRATGAELWRASWEGALRVPFFARSNGDWIRATPACDGERLYVAGMRDVLACLNVADGRELWRSDFVRHFDAALPAFGFVSSPLVRGDYVYVQAGAGFCKVEKLTGKVVWRVLRDGGGMWGSAFSSPTWANLAGREQVLVQTRNKLAGVDPDSGDVLWERAIEAFRGMNILTPTVVADAVFTSAYGGRSQLLRVTSSADSWHVDEAWTNKTQGYMSSPVVIGDHVYLHLRNQRFACLDARTGVERWITTPFGQYWSLVAAGDRILALDERGELLLIAADPAEFRLLARRKIAEQPTWGHLTVCGDELLVRELNALAVYRWATPASVTGGPQCQAARVRPGV